MVSFTCSWHMGKSFPNHYTLEKRFLHLSSMTLQCSKSNRSLPLILCIPSNKPSLPGSSDQRSNASPPNCTIPPSKHTQAIVNYWAISQDEKNWVNPEEFVSARFLRSEVDFRGTNFSYIPFGSGRRICPGMSLGIRFDWKLPNGMKAEDMDLGDKFGIDLQRATPLVATTVFLN